VRHQHGARKIIRYPSGHNGTTQNGGEQPWITEQRRAELRVRLSSHV